MMKYFSGMGRCQFNSDLFQSTGFPGGTSDKESICQCRKVNSESEVAQSCPTPSNPMDCSLPGSSIHGILQARILEWGAIAFSDDTHTGDVKGQLVSIINTIACPLYQCFSNFTVRMNLLENPVKTQILIQ